MLFSVTLILEITNSFIFSFNMKKFLFKSSFYLSGLILLFAFLGLYADGNTDDNYMHFAVEKPQNIILGDSRGAQAVVPSFLEKKLSRKFDNFSLNIAQSPYGQIYLKGLKRKIAPDTKDGIFILTVDPWCLSLHKDVKKSKDFPEVHSPLNNMYIYNWSPNYEYLLKNYKESWFNLYLNREEVVRSNTYLHKDGWLEVTVDMEKDAVAEREAQKVVLYKNMAKTQHLSNKRVAAFHEIIEYLKDKGRVYIVRIPASEKIMQIENKKFPEFSELLNNIAAQHHVTFYDFSERYSDYIYTDGNHMYKESGKVFTDQISDLIFTDKQKLK